MKLNGKIIDFFLLHLIYMYTRLYDVERFEFVSKQIRSISIYYSPYNIENWAKYDKNNGKNIFVLKSSSDEVSCDSLSVIGTDSW